MAKFSYIFSDFRAIKERDPASRGWFDRLLHYPGFQAIFCYRVAHVFWRRVPLIGKFIARDIQVTARMLTGVDIHPAAEIGPGLFIDHAMGVVIGETSEIGKNVSMFQEVTLGGTGKEKGHKRHPTIEDDVLISAGAKVLGAITVGAGSLIGANSVVVRDVPPNSTVVGVPGRVVRQEGRKIVGATFDHAALPDPIKEALENLQAQIERHERVKDLPSDSDEAGD
jgi:serine O-acetyltransferase